MIFILKATNLYYFHVYINSLFLFYQELDYLCNPNLMYWLYADIFHHSYLYIPWRKCLHILQRFANIIRLSIRNQDFIDCFILASCTVLFRNDAKSQCEDTVLLIPHNVWGRDRLADIHFIYGLVFTFLWFIETVLYFFQPEFHDFFTGHIRLVGIWIL